MPPGMGTSHACPPCAGPDGTTHDIGLYHYQQPGYGALGHCTQPGTGALVSTLLQLPTYQLTTLSLADAKAVDGSTAPDSPMAWPQYRVDPPQSLASSSWQLLYPTAMFATTVHTCPGSLRLGAGGASRHTTCGTTYTTGHRWPWQNDFDGSVLKRTR